MRHKHADVIHAWAEGAEVEFKCPGGKWMLEQYPNFYVQDEYRIKPTEPEWWESIPEHGILVKRIDSPDFYSVIYSQTIATPYIYEHWTPLTNEEIERFKR